MHYVGIHALAGAFHIEHDIGDGGPRGLIAVGTAYGGLRIFLARQGGMRLALAPSPSASRSRGCITRRCTGCIRTDAGMAHEAGRPPRLAQVLSLVVRAFVLPDRGGLPPVPGAGATPDRAITPRGRHGRRPSPERRARRVSSAPVHPSGAQPGPAQLLPAPLGGLGQPRAAPVSRLPVEAADGTHFIEPPRSAASRPMPITRWCATAAASACAPGRSRKPRRSSIPALSCASTAANRVDPACDLIRKEGDGAVVEPRRPGAAPLPVSRARIAELKARNPGLAKRGHRDPPSSRIGQKSLTHFVREKPRFVRNPGLGDARRARLACVPADPANEPPSNPREEKRAEDEGGRRMIPGPFSYHRPASIADAVKLLSTLGEEARPLAGGHSLIPMMGLGSRRPSTSSISAA